MKKTEIKQYDRVIFVGPEREFDKVQVGDAGYVIEVYGDNALEVEFSRADGLTYASHVVPLAYLKPG